VIELAIYEHKAALLGLPVSVVARDAALLATAVRREWETYGADVLTVGIDLYNVEAEACGATMNWDLDTACPEIAVPPYTLNALPDPFPSVDVTRDGRFPLMVEAGLCAARALGSAARVRVGMSGPWSVASKLVGMTELLAGTLLVPRATHRLVDFCAELCVRWASHLHASGLDVVVFDSAASPPLLSPSLYRAFVWPHHRSLMQALAACGQSERPLIMGGDTTSISQDLIRAGANWILCDYGCDASAFANAIRPFPEVVVRRNADPRDLLHDTETARCAAHQVARDLRHFDHPIAGVGVLPYDTPPDNVIAYVRELRAWTEP